MSLAPSIRGALRRVTAKDLVSWDHDGAMFLMKQSMLEAEAYSSKNLSEGVGKFWATDLDSDCDDLGEGVLLQRPRSRQCCR